MEGNYSNHYVLQQGNIVQNPENVSFQIEELSSMNDNLSIFNHATAPHELLYLDEFEENFKNILIEVRNAPDSLPYIGDMDFNIGQTTVLDQVPILINTIVKNF